MPGPTPSQPGWYADGDGGERWYDGNAWTEHRRGAAADESTVVVPTSTPPTGEQPGPVAPGPLAAGPLAPGQLQVGKGLRIALAIGGVLALIAIVVIGAIVLTGDDEDKDKAGDDPSSTTTETGPTTDESSLDLPTIDSSDFPSDVPTIPSSSDTPPEQPELPGLPKDFPSGFPTEFPTDPSALESWFSDYLEQVQP